MKDTRKKKRYSVLGSGSFPFDMLHHDASYPFSQSDAAAMAVHRLEPRRVELVGMLVNGWPSTERWASFGWEVNWVQSKNKPNTSRAYQHGPGWPRWVPLRDSFGNVVRGVDLDEVMGGYLNSGPWRGYVLDKDGYAVETIIAPEGAPNPGPNMEKEDAPDKST